MYNVFKERIRKTIFFCSTSEVNLQQELLLKRDHAEINVKPRKPHFSMNGKSKWIGNVLRDIGQTQVNAMCRWGILDVTGELG